MCKGAKKKHKFLGKTDLYILRGRGQDIWKIKEAKNPDKSGELRRRLYLHVGHEEIL